MKKNEHNDQVSLHFIFSMLAKSFWGALARKLEGKGPERYFYTLLVIHEKDEQITQQELADYFKIDKASMVRVIDYLSKAGYIKRKVDPSDRRQHFLLLTSRGKAFVPVLKEAIEELNALALDGIGEKEKKAFYEMLEKVCGNLAQLPKDNFFLNFKKINR
jgi:DNA-binding MarR family transcriptional regulator